MKKVLISIVVVILLIAGALYAAFQLFLTQESPEYTQYNKEKIEADINAQLKGIDLEKIRKKEALILEKSVEDLQSSVKSGELTYEELTAFYLDRILKIDQNDKGINSIAEVNPKAIEQARKFDEEFKKNKDNSKLPLYGIPVTLKDNINTMDMPTSAGTYILKDFVPQEDADVTKKLKDAGALIMAKANLSELANFMAIKMPDGYSSKTGQTINPFNPIKSSASGSSAGSAASITSNIGVISIGSETTGSIISPSVVESVVGFKPNHNSVSGEGIFPLSSSIDTAGPIARTVKDVVYGYNAIVVNPDKKVDISDLDANFLQGKRLGITEVSKNKKEFEKLKSILKKLNVELVDIKINSEGINSGEIIDNEFKFDVMDFAKKYDLPFKTVSELIAFNNKDIDRRAKYGQGLIEKANETKKKDTVLIEKQIKLAQSQLNKLKETHKLDAIISIGDGEVMVPAVAGYAELTVPFEKSEDGENLGIVFYGLNEDNINIVKLAYSFEQNTKGRMIAKFN